MRISVQRVALGALALVLLLVGGALVLWYWAGPALVERRVAETLRARGVPVSAMVLRSVGFDSAVLTDVRIGIAGGIAIDRVEARYDPSGLLRDGRIDRLDIAGVRVDLSGGFGDAGRAGSIAGFDGRLPVLPIGVIAMRDSAIIIDTPIGAASLAVDLEARPKPEGAIDLDGRILARADQGEASLPFQGGIAPDGRFDIGLTLEAGRLLWHGAGIEGLTGAATVVGTPDGLSRAAGSFAATAVTLPDGSAMRLSVDGELGEGAGRLALMLLDDEAEQDVALDLSLEAMDTDRPAIAATLDADLAPLRALLALAGVEVELGDRGAVQAALSGSLDRMADGPLPALSGTLTLTADLAAPVPDLSIDLATRIAARGDRVELVGVAPWNFRWKPAAVDDPVRLTLGDPLAAENRLSLERDDDAWLLKSAGPFRLAGWGGDVAGGLDISVALEDGRQDPAGGFEVEIRGSGGGPWQVMVDDAVVSGDGTFAVEDGRWRVTVDSCLEVAAGRLAVGRALAAPEGFSACVIAPPDRPALIVSPAGTDRLDAGFVIRLAPLGLRVDAGAAGPITFDIDLPNTVVAARLPAGDGPTIDLTTRSGSIRLPDLGVALEDVAAAVSAAPAEAGPASIRLESGTLRSLREPAWFAPLTVTAEAGLNGSTGLEFAGAAVGGAGAAMVDFAGRHDAADGQGRVELHLAPVSFAPDVRQPTDLIPVLGLPDAVSVVGTVSGAARIGWGRRQTSSGELSVEGLTLLAPGAAVRDIAGTLRADSLFPLRLPDGQLLAVAGADLGVELEQGAVAFGLADGDRLSVQGMGFGFAGGVLAVEPFEARLGDRDLSVVVRIAEADLALLSEQFPVRGLTVTGRLGGRIPIRLIDDTIAIDNGMLEAAEPGLIRYLAPLPGVAEQEGGVALLLSAVRNFHYEGLRVTLNGRTGDDLEVAVRLTGANPDLYDGYPVALNINLSGALDEILRSGLRSMGIADEAGSLLRERGAPAR